MAAAQSAAAVARSAYSERAQALEADRQALKQLINHTFPVSPPDDGT